MIKYVSFFLLSFSIYAQQSAENFSVFGKPQAKYISIDNVLIHIRELKIKSSISYGEAVDFYYHRFVSTGKNQWIEKLEEFSLDPDCPAKFRNKINEQIQKIRTLQVGEKAPEIDFKEFHLSDYNSSKKNVLLLFYSPSCFHCTELLIDLIPYSIKNKLPVIALQIDEEMNPWSFPDNWISIKADANIRKDYGIFSSPSLFLINTKSKNISAIPENLTELKELEHLF
jgi:thiol-disulfide isomerase/thioredoxin